MTGKKIIVTGMPRSGTSWLGQIVNSNPYMAFRTEPLFSYRFKNQLDPDSSCYDIQDFFEQLLRAGNDEFLLQQHLVDAGSYPSFEKRNIRHLGYKTSRHHELLEQFLTCLPELRVIGIVRHPCGAINSWLQSGREFHSKGCTVSADWRSGDCRKDGPGEYWGFSDWLAVTAQFVELSQRFPNFLLVRYGDLVREPEQNAYRIFEAAGLEWARQTKTFLRRSQALHHVDPYAVFKDRSVLDRWKHELDGEIAGEIIKQTRAAGLEWFLDEKNA